MRNGMVGRNEPLRDLLTRGKKKTVSLLPMTSFFIFSFLFSKKKSPSIFIGGRRRTVHVRSTNQMV